MRLFRTTTLFLTAMVALATFGSGGHAIADPSLPPQLPGFALVVHVDHYAGTMRCEVSGGIPGAAGVVQFDVTTSNAGLPQLSKIDRPLQFDATGHATTSFNLSDVVLAGPFVARAKAFVFDPASQALGSSQNDFIIAAYWISDYSDLYGIDPAAASYLDTLTGATGALLPPVTDQSHAFLPDQTPNGILELRGSGWVISANVTASCAPSGPAGIFGGN